MSVARGGGPAVDRPEVVLEVEAAFERYEAALVEGDLPVLGELFWDDARTERVGPESRQHGAAEVRAHRASLPRQTVPRRLVDTVVTTFGDDVACVTTTFVPLDAALPAGRQSQTWVRFADGWRVVAAHVSYPSG